MIDAPAAIPAIQSAIAIGSDAARVKLDLYLTPEQVADLMRLKDTELRVRIERASTLDENGLYLPEGT